MLLEPVHIGQRFVHVPMHSANEDLKYKHTGLPVVLASQ